MKISGVLLVCSFATISSDLIYNGKNESRKHVYILNGFHYVVPQVFHDYAVQNPDLAERKLIEEIQRTGSTPPPPLQPSTQRQKPTFFGNGGNKRQDPSGAEISDSQNYNEFRPNKKPQSPPSRDPSASNIYFPPSSQNNFENQNIGLDSIPTQSTGFNRPIPREREREEYQGSRPVTDFAWNLFKSSNTQQNFVLSPLSPQILLSYLTWVADGATRSELMQAIGFGSPAHIQKLVSSMLSDSSNRELQIATAFFTSKEMRLNQEFLDKSINFADIVPVDFKQPQLAGQTISKWAKQKTKGGLKLNEINYAPSTKIALTSAIYFKGNFVYTFQPAQPGTFYTPNGNVVAQMMNMKRKFHWGEIENYAEWVSIPYESSDSLVIILPKENQNIDSVINKMKYRDIDTVVSNIDRESSKAEVNLTLPKFKIESTTNLVEPLQKMGISTLFSTRASLPYLSDYDSVQVSNAQQQASMEVNEEGTVLIAFTNLNVVALSFQPPVPKVEFVVNRPFLAIIVNRNKSIPYVIAKISNPLN